MTSQCSSNALLLLFATLFCITCCAQSALADSGRYRGASGADWTDGTNWDDGAGAQLAAGVYPGSSVGNVATFGLDPAAPAAVSDGEVLLPSNVGSSAPVELIIENDAGDVVIDLNGNTLTLSELTVASGASLTLRDLSGNGGRLIVGEEFSPGAASGAIVVESDAVLEFAGGYGPTGPATLMIELGGLVEMKGALARMSDTTLSNAGVLRIQPTETELVVVSGNQISGVLEVVTSNSPARSVSVDALENLASLNASGGGSITISGALTTSGEVSLASVALSVGSAGASIGGDLSVSSTQGNTGRITSSGDVSVSGATSISGAQNGVNEASLGVSNTSAQLAITISPNQPNNMAAGEPTGDSTLATAALVVLNATGSSVNVDALTFNVDTTNLTSGDIQTGSLGDVVLFRDANDNQQFDSGESLASRNGTSIPGGVRFVLSPAITLSANAPETWGIAFLTTANASGTIGVSLSAGALEASGSPIVTGLPISSQSIDVARPAVLTVVGVDDVNLRSASIPRANENVKVLALRLSNSGAGTARVEGIDLQINAAWNDSTSFDPNTAITRVSTYVDGNALGAATTNNGLYEADNNLDERLDRQTVSGLLTIGAGNGGRLMRTATLALLFSTPLEIEPSEQKVLYFVAEITSSGTTLNQAVALELDLSLALLAGSPPAISLGAPADVVQPLAADVSSRNLTFRTQPKKADTGCALVAGGSSWIAALIALIAAAGLFTMGRIKAQRE